MYRLYLSRYFYAFTIIYGLTFNNNRLAVTSDYRGSGWSLRCLARWPQMRRGFNLRKRSYGHSSGTASDSICPKGWRLPGSSGEDSYSELFQKYTSHSAWDTIPANADTAVQINPLNFLRSGYYNYDSGSLNYRTSRGYYWSGHYYSITNSHLLDFYSTRLYPQVGYDRGYGYSLRCLAR